MYQRLLAAILLGVLAHKPTFGQDESHSDDSFPTNRYSSGDIRAQKTLRLKGVLVSDSSRTALINGRPVQEGDRIGGAEILSIEQRGIRVRLSGEVLTVNIGGTFRRDSAAPAFVKATERPASASERRATPVQAKSVAVPAAEPGIESNSRHTVAPGETLSGIALGYLKDGITLEQMMMAFFRSNPAAFRDNINVLYAGATLSVPERQDAAQEPAAIAVAEVGRHLESWRRDARESGLVAVATTARQYGPVETGESLSTISARVQHNGVTLQQTMMALFQANPQAFGNNINTLYEGAVLRLPSENELRRQAPEAAAAEVLRQTRTWRTGKQQHALAAPPEPEILAAADWPAD